MDFSLGHTGRKGAAKFPSIKPVISSWREHPPNARLAHPDWIVANHLEDQYWECYEEQFDYVDASPVCMPSRALDWEACFTNYWDSTNQNSTNGRHPTITRIAPKTKKLRLIMGREERRSALANERHCQRKRIYMERIPTVPSKRNPHPERRSGRKREIRPPQNKLEAPRVVRGTMSCVAIYDANILKYRRWSKGNHLYRGCGHYQGLATQELGIQELASNGECQLVYPIPMFHLILMVE